MHTIRMSCTISPPTLLTTAQAVFLLEHGHRHTHNKLQAELITSMQNRQCYNLLHQQPLELPLDAALLLLPGVTLLAWQLHYKMLMPAL